MKPLLAPILALAAAAPLGAQAIDSDPRIVTVAYNEAETVTLRSAAGNALTIVFAPGERVSGFEVADPAAVEVSLAGNADTLFVRTLRRPADPQLAVRTNLRSYRFAIALGAPEAAAYVVRFGYAPAPGTRAPERTAAQAKPAAPRYKVSGDRALRPLRISDDGIRTFIEWGPEQLLPAVFALNALGGEEMVDGYMRDGIYTIDRINPRLLFRIDKKSAKAERIVSARK